VTLVAPEEPFFSRPGLVAVLAFVMLCVVIGWAISRYAWRDRRLATPEERAFRSLARAMGLSRSEVGVLRRLARASGVAEVSLVLSRGAFDRFSSLGEGRNIEELRSRLFSDRSS
ncbi:MAG: hypothetical protein JNK58_07670, partial [Phycisphaerae bacterium]|nr:hypothetical protein [Phycisphaerae bacterium]